MLIRVIQKNVFVNKHSISEQLVLSQYWSEVRLALSTGIV